MDHCLLGYVLSSGEESLGGVEHILSICECQGCFELPYFQSFVYTLSRATRVRFTQRTLHFPSRPILLTTLYALLKHRTRAEKLSPPFLPFTRRRHSGESLQEKSRMDNGCHLDEQVEFLARGLGREAFDEAHDSRSPITTMSL